MSYRTNRKTGGIFPVGSEIQKSVPNSNVANVKRYIDQRRKSLRPELQFINVVEEEFSKGDEIKYGATLAESRYNASTGDIVIVVGGHLSDVDIEHELGHIISRAFGYTLPTSERKKLSRDLEEEHEDTDYANNYYDDSLDEALAETFAAKRFGWKRTALGFDPAVRTPRIWAFAGRMARWANK